MGRNEPENRMNDLKIALDMDGVLADTYSHASATAGRELLTPGSWDIDFDFDAQPLEWWLSMPPMPDIMFSATFLAIPTTYLVTARRGNAIQAIVPWMRRFVPDFTFDRVILIKDKYLLARPGRVLIDDADHNVDNWVAAGGEGILVPRPWNSKHKEYTL